MTETELVTAAKSGDVDAFCELYDFVEVSPSTQRTASEILLLPEPFGPTTAVMPFPNVNSVLSGNDLNPCISSVLNNIAIP